MGLREVVFVDSVSVVGPKIQISKSKLTKRKFESKSLIFLFTQNKQKAIPRHGPQPMILNMPANKQKTDFSEMEGNLDIETLLLIIIKQKYFVYGNFPTIYKKLLFSHALNPLA